MKIMAIKTELLSELKPNTFYDLTPGRLAMLRDYQYLEREPLENDPTYRQVIPYVVVSSPRGICLMQRCKGQGEARLLGKHYIGAGGHVEDGHTVFYTALKECTEELGLPLRTLDLTGVMLTDGSAVDNVHLCIFGRADSNYTEFQSPEGALHNARWVDPAELLRHVDTMEKWSQIIVEHLFKSERQQAQMPI